MRPNVFAFFRRGFWGIFLPMSAFSWLNRLKEAVPRDFLREFSKIFELTWGTMIHEAKNLVTLSL
jgi:hypothetical protein